MVTGPTSPDAQALATIDALVQDGRLAEARARLLELWRVSRTPALAGLIESISLLVDLDALPGRPERWWRGRASAAVYPWHFDPWGDLPAPDPRSTRALVLAANHVFAFLHAHEPRWPDQLTRRLLAHGDPRALEFLGRALVGRSELFRDELARLAAGLPRPAELDPAADAVALRIAGRVAHADTALQRALVAASDEHRQIQLIALALTRRSPGLGWTTYRPLFAAGELVGLTFPPIVASLRAAVGLAEWRSVRELLLGGVDPYFADDVHPSAWVEEHAPGHGPRVRAALVDLLTHPVMAGLRAIGTLSVALLGALADAGHHPPWTRLYVWYDPTLASTLTRLAPPALTDLEVAAPGMFNASVGPGALHDLWATSVGPGLRRLSVWPTGPRAWSTWLAEGAVPTSVEMLVQRGGDWTATFRRTPGGWDASLEIREHWEIFDGEFQDPPTPGAEILEFLLELDTDRLTGLTIDSLGELEETDAPRVAAAARRQVRLTGLRLPDELEP